MDDYPLRSPDGSALSSSDLFQSRTQELFQEQWNAILCRTDRGFAILLSLEWLACILLALLLSPETWDGQQSQTHPHVGTAIFLGGLLTLLPVALALHRPGHPITRYVIAVAQLSFSGLLIHLSGGRIESHFHIFGSLAFLYFYKDWRVFIPATAVIALDHTVRGLYFPLSIYGIDWASPWRTVEHIWWVVFEVSFLVMACFENQKGMRKIAHQRAHLELTNSTIETAIAARTAELDRSRRELQQTVDALSGMMRAARMGRWEFHRSSNTVVWSGDSFRDFGLPQGKALSLETMMTFLAVEDQELFQEAWQAAQAGESFSVEFRVMEGDRVHWVWAQSLYSSLESPLASSVGTFQDISQRRRADEDRRRLESKLQEGQKLEAIGLLAGGVAHDFNNMLSIITGHSDLAFHALGPEDAVREHIAEIRNASDRSATLVRQLLTFARQQPVEPQNLDLNLAIAETIGMLRVLMGENIELSWEACEGLAWVKIDKAQLDQVLTNLAINARDAITGIGNVNISVSRVEGEAEPPSSLPNLPPGPYLVIRVSDSGCGMSPDVQERVLEPFFTTKSPGEGTGLGLPSVYGIVKQNGGDMQISSTLGEGSTFQIYLPAASEMAGQSNVVKPVVLPPGEETVLVVEDEPALLQLVQRQLQRLGYKVLTASLPSQAVELVGSYPEEIHLLLTDVIMPEMNGSELSKILVEKKPLMQVLFMSGYTAKAISESEVHFLAKPFSMPELAAKVRESLSAQRSPLRC